MDAYRSLREAIRDVPDFPKPGIVFKDLTPILGDGTLFRLAVDGLADAHRGAAVQMVAGIDARGFLFSAAVAYTLGVGLIPLRKKGKLPWHTESASYQLEYGEASIEVHRDALQPGDRILLVDDLLATGGTAAAAVNLLRRLGGEVVEASFVVELSSLEGRARLPDVPVRSLVRF